MKFGYTNILFVIILLMAPSGLLFAQDTVSVEELNRRVEILADEIQALKAHQTNISVNKSVFGMGNSASKIYHIPQGLSIGGYAEMTYKDWGQRNEAGAPTNKNQAAEVLRNILYFGYKFNDKWLANIEIEIEHVGEVNTEFLYIDYLHSKNFNFRTGLMLHPIGFINELHEPVLFPSVSRPEVETVIIPTTWRELGAGAFGSFGNTSYKFYVMNGMNADGFTASSNRGARKGGGVGELAKNQRASSLVSILRLDHQFSRALTIGGSMLYGNASGAKDQLGQTMVELHLEAKKWGHKLRALGVQNSFRDVAHWNQYNSASLAQRQRGYYFEYSYSINLSGTNVLRPFGRFESINMQSKLPTGVAKNGALDYKHYVVGLNYLPFDRLVFKADYTWEKKKDKSGEKLLQVGVGFNY